MSLLENIYECADFFLTRTSLSSLEILNSHLNQNRDDLLHFAMNDPVFLEAITIASPTLSRSIHRFIQSTDKNAGELKKIRAGMLKYFLRMSSRATPFGLFSFVWWGKFSDKTHLQFEQSDIKKSIRPDMEWIYSLINLLSKDYSYIRHFKVMTSPFIYEECGKYYLKKLNASTNKEELTSIKHTEFTQKAFSIAKTPIAYLELERKLLSLFSKYDPKKITDCLWDIFQKEYFINELYPEVNKPFNVEKFLLFLSQHKEQMILPECQTALRVLLDFCMLIREYQEAPIGDGMIQLDNLKKVAKQIMETENVIQLDAFKNNGEAFLSQELKRLIEEIASVLCHFSSQQSRLDHISDYHSEFTEKYGLHRLVSISELINPISGLGIPVKGKINESKNHERVHAILSQILSTKQSEIVLDGILTECLTPAKGEVCKSPLSVELFFEILTPSQEHLDKGDYQILLNPLVASAQAGSTFGRFLYLFDQKKTTQLSQLLKREENLLYDVAFVEASFQPLKARTTNVCFHEKSREFQLQFYYRELNHDVVEIQDIYVGANDRGLYLYSRKLQKEIKVVLSTAVNSEFAPPILKLMLDISESEFKQFNCFIFEEFKSFIFLPRARYKNVILSPARWYFTFQNLNLDEDAKVEKVDRAMQEAMRSFGVPDQIFLIEFDNRLLLRRFNSQEYKLLLDHFMLKKELILFECMKCNDYLPVVKSENGHHVSEFVVPLVKKRSNFLPKVFPVHPLNNTIHSKERKQLAGSSHWLYAKLFLPIDFEKEFISHYLHPFVSHLINSAIIDRWFFVRYQEDKHHIRLRLHGHPEILNTQGLLSFSNWMGDLSENQLISEFSFHNYDREIERYGGPDLMDLAEEMFCFDSDFCAYVLKTSENEKMHFKLEWIAAFTILFLLRIFYSNHQSMVYFLSRMEGEMSMLKGCREKLKEFNKIANWIWFNPEHQGKLNDLSSTKNILDALGSLSQQFDRFKTKMDESLNNNRLWNNKDHIVDSFIHMHCNRLLGTNVDLEKKARVIAYAQMASKRSG